MIISSLSIVTAQLLTPSRVLRSPSHPLLHKLPQSLLSPTQELCCCAPGSQVFPTVAEPGARQSSLLLFSKLSTALELSFQSCLICFFVFCFCPSKHENKWETLRKDSNLSVPEKGIGRKENLWEEVVGTSCRAWGRHEEKRSVVCRSEPMLSKSQKVV